jgi:hypothetical protein
VYRSKDRHAARTAARHFEDALRADVRKRLGQFFTGVPLGKVLAHIALTPETHTILDPMVGHGDLLDAAAEAAHERGIELHRLDGIEIEPATADICRNRLSNTVDLPSKALTVLHGNAFDDKIVARLPRNQYDLVIANPPYVRYQTGGAEGGPAVAARAGLSAAADRFLTGSPHTVWQTLIRGYSGLADLSVPSWLLAGLLVRPGGTLALVVPATWRSRNYGDVIRYFMLRCFRIRCIVEDTQPGWFSDALVRTHLIVATRLQPDDIAVSLQQRLETPPAPWLSISPEAADDNSIVGRAFGGALPEYQLAALIADGTRERIPGITVASFDTEAERMALKAKAHSRPWFRELEGDGGDLPLFATPRSSVTMPLPEAVRDLTMQLPSERLTSLERIGVHVGQGLRTGCNHFFYLDALEEEGSVVRVRTSAAFGGHELVIPHDAVRPVVRKQADLPDVERGFPPRGRVLDLRHWCLPEDCELVGQATPTYRKLGEAPPAIMTDDLAKYVREASRTAPSGKGGKLTAELSAVRTNVRLHRSGAATPRFWYMLPDFMPRHLPLAFVPRVIDGAPWVERNLHSTVLVDANFSTFWASKPGWTGYAIKALLNSTWCRLLMEAIGTPMGGGALKLEATHLRFLPVPFFTDEAHRILDELGRRLVKRDGNASDVDEVVAAALSHQDRRVDLLSAMHERSERLRQLRRRRAA